MALKFQVLSRQAIRGLTAGERITEHGITAEKLPNGDVKYSVNIMVDRQRVHRAIGRESDGVTRTQCETFIENTRTKAREGRLSLPRGRKVAMGFADAARKYLKHQEESDGKNLDAKTRHINTLLIPHFGSVSMEAITPFAIERYKRDRKKSGASGPTINRDLATLSHFLRLAHEWQWRRTAPPKIPKFPENIGRIIALSDEQCDSIFKAAIADQDEQLWLFVAFALNTAMRHSEILQSRFEHVAFDRLRLHVPEAKAGAREQPITRELADILLKERETATDKDGWIFPTPRPGACKTGHRHRIDSPFKRAVKAAGMDPKLITPHVLRHTAITRLIESGIDIPTVQAIAGHRTVAMTLRYTHISSKHVDSAVAILGRGIPDLQKNKAGTVTPKLHQAGGAND